jgi:hypothetical protein
VNPLTVSSPDDVLDAPDFYWIYRAEKLSSRFGRRTPFKLDDYRGLTGEQAFDCYLAILKSSNSLPASYNVYTEKVTDEEWNRIWARQVEWMDKVIDANPLTTDTLPKNDFDLLKQFYPYLDFTDLETPFTSEEVGENFPYKNLKDLFAAASEEKLDIPGFNTDIDSLECPEIRKELEALKDSTLKSLAACKDKCLALARSPFPDDKAKAHYKELKEMMAGIPMTAAEKEAFKTNEEKMIAEMAAFASKEDEEEHHHHDEGICVDLSRTSAINL